MVIYHPWFCVLFSSASLSVPFKALCALQSEHCWREWKGPERRLRPTGLSWLQLSPITMAQCADRLHRINFLREHTVTSVCQDYPACIHGPQANSTQKTMGATASHCPEWQKWSLNLLQSLQDLCLARVWGVANSGVCAGISTPASGTVCLELKTHRCQSDLPWAQQDHSPARNTTHLPLIPLPRIKVELLLASPSLPWESPPNLQHVGNSPPVWCEMDWVTPQCFM